MHSRRGFLRRAGALAALPSLGTVACAGADSAQRSSSGAAPGDSASWFQVDWEHEKVEKGVVTDTLVIHHTGLAPGITWQQLSELQRQSIYLPRFTCECDDPMVKGQPPHSGHYRLVKGRLEEVFFAYHFIIRQNGSMEALLGVHEVGWHAGNWDVNLRSLGICFDGDFSTARPSETALNSCAGLMNALAKSHPIRYLMGHHEAMAAGKTQCPGSWLSERGPDGLTGKALLNEMANLELRDLVLER